jgi:hypothetical protein
VCVGCDGGSAVLIVSATADGVSEHMFVTPVLILHAMIVLKFTV